MRKAGYFFALLVFLAFHFSACNQIKEVKDAFFGEAVPGGGSPEGATTDKKKKVKKAPEKETAGETAPKKPPATTPPSTVAETKEAAPAETTPPLPAAPDKTPPLVPLEHFGGNPGFLFSDGAMLYAGFGRRLVFYDRELNEISSISLEAEIEKVIPQKGAAKQSPPPGTSPEGASGNLIYVGEKGKPPGGKPSGAGLFEIITYPSTAVPSKVLKTFEVEGPFDVEPATNRLFVYLPDKVQILDLNDLNKVEVAAEIPLGGVSQMMVLDGYYYSVHGTSLTIVEASTLSILASIPLGTAFKIIQSREEADGLYLVLLLESPQTGKGQTLQWMPLVEGGRGISDPGKGVELAIPVDEVFSDGDQPYLYFLRQGDLSVFDLTRRVELGSASNQPVKNIQAIHGTGGVVFAASSTALGRFEHPLPQPTTKTSPADKATTPPPLAEAASQPKKPEPPGGLPPGGKPFVWKNEKTVLFPGSITALWLPSRDAALFAGDSLFFSRSFLSGPSPLLPLKPPKGQAMKVALGLSYQGAILLFDETSGKIFVVKGDFSGLQEVALAAQNIVGMDEGNDGGEAVPGGGKTDYLYLAVAKKNNTGETALTAYQFQSPLSVKKIGSLPFAEIGGFGLYAGATRGIVACGSAGVCLVDVGTKRNKMKIIASVASSQKEAKAMEVKVSPDEKVAYVFYEKADGSFISIVNLQGETAKELAMIPNVKMTASQFRGISFTGGGKILLAPDDEGLSVYNVKNPRNPGFGYRWPVGKVFHADVTNRGKTVCVALGLNGVECGSF